MKPLSQDLCKVAMEIYQAIGSPIALSCAILLRYEDYRGLAEKRISPCEYLDAESYFRDVQAVDLLRKLKLPTGIDTSAVALQKWWDDERHCGSTNRRLQQIRLRMDFPLAEDGLDRSFCLQARLIELVRKKLGWLIGSFPRCIEGRMGKHATFAHKGERCLLPDKFSACPEATNDRLVELTSLQHTSWGRRLQGMLFAAGPVRPLTVPLVAGNRYATVPKDGTTDRSIGIEPTLNLFYQLGIGDVLKRRLAKRGLLLSPRTPGVKSESQVIHRRLALSASKTLSLCTLDLSSASDTVATELVRLLLSAEWFEGLSVGRSPRTLLPNGKWVKLEKFSSMGNGYTFELETAIFAAITMSVCEMFDVPYELGTSLSVYGDDIIAPIEAADHIMTALRFFGFKPNPRKSFTSGLFRESCGGDYFGGVDVRPVLLKKDPETPLEWISLHNQVKRLDGRLSVRRALNHIKGLVPSAVRRCCGPLELGDIVFHSEPDSWRLKILHSTRRIQTCQPATRLVPLVRWDEASAVVALLYGVPSDGLAPRGDPDGYRITWTALP